MDISEQKNLKHYTRRDFIKNLAIGGGAALIFGNIGVLHLSAAESGKNRSYSAIVVDLH